MERICILIINKLLLIMSFCPIFALVDKKRFMNIEYAYNQKNQKYAISEASDIGIYFINIRLGGIAIQMLGLHAREVSLVHLADIEEINTAEFTKSFFSDKESEYTKHIDFLNEKDLKMEENALNDHMKFYEDAIKKINDKFKSLQSVLVIGISLFFSILARREIYSTVMQDYEYRIAIICILLNFYIVLNIVLLMIQFYSIKPRRIEKFYDLKISSMKHKKIVIQKYMNWLYLRPLYATVAAYAEAYKGMLDFVVIINSAFATYYLVKLVFVL